MKRVHVLSVGFSNPNSRAFLFPLLAWHHELREDGYDLRFSHRPASGIDDCATLLLDSKILNPLWQRGRTAALDFLETLRRRVGLLVYCNLLDSTGWDHAHALPHVDCYLKNQLLRDRQRYLEPYYGYRIFADYFHRMYGVEDERPERSEPVKNASLLGRLRVGWNSGLAEYSWATPLTSRLYRRFRRRFLLNFPRSGPRPATARRPLVTCRMGTSYERASVGAQRVRLKELLKDRLASDKRSRWAYLAELRRSFAAVSPFGLGEITLKDFEVFQSGALLIKPDMAHLETWPDFFRRDETYRPFAWDGRDLPALLDAVERRPDDHLDVARAGQEAYRLHTSDHGAGRRFARRFAETMEYAERFRRF